MSERLTLDEAAKSLGIGRRRLFQLLDRYMGERIRETREIGGRRRSVVVIAAEEVERIRALAYEDTRIPDEPEAEAEVLRSAHMAAVLQEARQAVRVATKALRNFDTWYVAPKINRTSEGKAFWRDLDRLRAEINIIQGQRPEK
jgi:predicted DNA-binding protein (UPF0251 family)